MYVVDYAAEIGEIPVDFEAIEARIAREVFQPLGGSH